MKSRILSVSPRLTVLFRRISEDRLSVHAAHASFFVITSAVPFASLLFTVAGAFLPEGTAHSLLHFAPDTALSALITCFASEIRSIPGVSLLSFSAVTTLWTASRGISGIRLGLETVYGCGSGSGYVVHRLRSLFFTLLFVLLLGGGAVIFLFGILHGGFPPLTTGAVRWILLWLLLSAVFTGFYVSAARRSQCVRHEISRHLPGAVFAAMGWNVFSWGYSLYIVHFPSAGTVYGGLAAVCLMMLWLYFCMMILLLGGEINRLFFAGISGNE